MMDLITLQYTQSPILGSSSQLCLMKKFRILPFLLFWTNMVTNIIRAATKKTMTLFNKVIDFPCFRL